MIYVTNIYGYKHIYVVYYSNLLRIFVMCYVVTILLNLSKYFAYKLPYAVLDALYCQWTDSEFFFERVPAYREPVFLTHYCVG